MATRSSIAIRRKDGTVSQIYCHHDGYLSHNGRILFEHYATEERVEALMELGDLSSLGEHLAPPEGAKHDFSKPLPNTCVAYGRDRGESNVSARRYGSEAEFKLYGLKEEYNYVFDANVGSWKWKSAQ